MVYIGTRWQACLGLQHVVSSRTCAGSSDHTYVINNHGIMQRSFSIVALEMTIFWPYKTNKVYKLSYIIRDNVLPFKKRELCVHAL